MIRNSDSSEGQTGYEYRTQGNGKLSARLKSGETRDTNAMLQQLLSLVRTSVREPRAGARQVLDLQPSNVELAQATALVIIMSTVLSNIASLFASSEEGQTAWMATQPLQSLLIPALIVAITVLGTYLVGRLFGGKGSLTETVAIIVWLQFVMLFCELAQVVTILLLGQLMATIVIAISVVLYFWLFSGFICVLHGFASARKVFFTTVGLVLSCSFIFAYFYLTFAAPPVEAVNLS